MGAVTTVAANVPDWGPGFYGYMDDGDTVDWDCPNCLPVRSYSSDYEAFQKEILYERARELANEESHRYFDIIRTNTFMEAFNAYNDYNPEERPSTKVTYGSKFQTGAYGYGVRVRSGEDGGASKSNPLNNGPQFIGERQYLMPIPLAELDNNPNVQQNPGY